MWPVTSITSNYFNDIETADLLADGLVVFLFVHAGQTGAKVPCSAFNNFLVSVGLKGIVQLAELACWLLSPSNQLGLATGSSEHETTFTTTGPPPSPLWVWEQRNRHSACWLTRWRDPAEERWPSPGPSSSQPGRRSSWSAGRFEPCPSEKESRDRSAPLSTWQYCAKTANAETEMCF